MMSVVRGRPEVVGHISGLSKESLRQGHQLEQGLLAFLFHEIREPLKLTSQNQPAM
jgi:hypothetical protein